MSQASIRRVGKIAAASFAVVALCAGCRITHSGKDRDVSIDTPLGGMQVKRDPAKVLERIGLPQYPGSTIVPKNIGGDDRSADVDMSFGQFHLRVLALSLQTYDAQSDVENFYRKSLAQYSDVIACRNQQPIGTPTKTGMGLTCSDEDDERSGHRTRSEGDELQLRAGSRERRHIVAIKPKNGATRVELIALDLPHGDKHGDND